MTSPGEERRTVLAHDRPRRRALAAVVADGALHRGRAVDPVDRVERVARGLGCAGVGAGRLVALVPVGLGERRQAVAPVVLELGDAPAQLELVCAPLPQETSGSLDLVDAHKSPSTSASWSAEVCSRANGLTRSTAARSSLWRRARSAWWMRL